MILDDIIKERLLQLEREKAAFSADDALTFVKRAAEKISVPALDFKSALKNPAALSVIAEVKKASPSRGIIARDFDPVKIAAEYEKNGASAISVLTEEHFFMGSNEYLKRIRESVTLPLLRKDFIVDAFQIYHARILGADAILLIAASLDTDTMKEFVKIAESLSLHVLAEAHNEEEVERVIVSGSGIIGINNRDLKTFVVDLAVTERLIGMIGGGFTKVSESGIKTADDMKRLKLCGADAVLIGETLIRGGNLEKLIGGVA
jgi:indole-3-glycerol phosphate synthase